MAMLRGQTTYLVEHGRIETTVTRAKEVRSLAEKMITIAKEPTLANKRRVLAFVTKEDVVKKLFDEIAPEYAGRPGGYTRIIRTGPRRGDAAEMCIIELVKEEKKAAKRAGRTARAGRGNRAARVKKSAETVAEAVEALAGAAPEAEGIIEEAAAE
jgi:large subunit ribosomal protein L17